MQRVVVIGGGISGLAAAQALHEHALDRGARTARDIVVLEGAPHVGGKATAKRHADWLIEAGPTGFLDKEPVLTRLIEVAGLAKVPATPSAARRYIVRGGRPRELHAHPLRFARSGILSPLGLLRVAAERLVPRRPETAGGEESVWQFARRRLGREAADRLIAPMVSGVHAGDAKRISLPAAFPRMQALEQGVRLALPRAGSTQEAGAAQRWARRSRGHPHVLCRRAWRSPPRLGGYGSLHSAYPARPSRASRLQSARPAGRLRWQTATPCTPRGSSWLRKAGPPQRCLKTSAPKAHRALTAIRYPPVTVVGLGFGQEALARCPTGFGGAHPARRGFPHPRPPVGLPSVPGAQCAGHLAHARHAWRRHGRSNRVAERGRGHSCCHPGGHASLWPARAAGLLPCPPVAAGDSTIRTGPRGAPRTRPRGPRRLASIGPSRAGGG